MLGAVVIAGPLLSACGLGPMVLPQPFSLSRAHFDGVSAGRDASVDEFLPWAEDQDEIIIVDKVSRKLVLYRHGEPKRTYAVVLGRNPGRKRFEGDRRTPSGLYHITSKNAHSRYGRFMAINYPNDADIGEYQTALTGRPNASILGHGSRGPGGLIGIHGSDKEDFNRLGINWTFGCVSLTNRDVEELYREVGEGTPVLIRDDQQP